MEGWSIKEGIDMELKVINYQSAAYESMCRLRDDVLRRPIGLRLSEEDRQKDINDILFAGMEGDEVIGCCILSQVDETTGKLRQMAVKEAYQGKGIGRKVLQFAEKWAWEQGYKTLTMHARKVATDFYLKEGYQICSNEFSEVGIPHFEMKKTKE